MSALAIGDNDFLAKLTRYGLLNSFESRVKKARRRIAHQPSIEGTFDLKNKIGSNAKLPDAAHRQELANLVARSSPIALDDCGRELLKCCYMVEGIDTGDAVWLSAAACDASSLVYTHDKNALRAVARQPACRPIYDRLAGRVRCLEQEMLALIDEIGFAVVRTAVAKEPEADGAMTNAFCEPGVNKVMATTKLIEYIEKLRAETGTLLSP